MRRVVVVLAVVVTAGCSAQVAGEATLAPAPPASVSTAAPDDGAPLATTPAPTTPTPTTLAPTPAPTTPAPAVTADSFPFTTPSGNIACSAFESSVRCDIRERTFDPGPGPAACADFDFGNSVRLTADAAELGCVSDSVGGGPVLPYGGTAEAGDLRCTSAESGVTCTALSTGRGFELSRDAVRTF